MQRSPEGDPPDGALVVPADYASVRGLAAHLQETCAAAGIDPAVTFDLELALVEAANNVVEHGYAGQEQGVLSLIVDIAQGQVRVTLADGGCPLPEAFLRDAGLPDGKATSGRGAAIIHACCDSIHYESSAGLNRLVMTRSGG